MESTGQRRPEIERTPLDEADAQPGDALGGMFTRQAIQLVMSKDWDLKVYDESDWIGPIIRCVADYDSGVGKYSAWGSQITCDGA